MPVLGVVQPEHIVILDIWVQFPQLSKQTYIHWVLIGLDRATTVVVLMSVVLLQ